MTSRITTPDEFVVRDCTLITRMARLDSAMNLRELHHRVVACPPQSLYHHFCETALRPTFDDPEFRNDFATWTARTLRDRVLAERLGALDPWNFAGLEQLRGRVSHILDDRLAELPMIPWAPRGQEFRFMESVTIVFDTGLRVHHPSALPTVLPQLPESSFYYHLIDGRRRPPYGLDDFSSWLIEYGDMCAAAVQGLAELETYYMTLTQLKTAMTNWADSYFRGWS